MAMKLLRQLYFGIKKEATRLTAETTADTWLPILSNSFDRNITYMEDDSAFGVRHSLMQRKQEIESLEGDIVAVADADNIGDWLFYLFGSVASVQEATSGAYKHTFSTLNNVLLPTFTAFYDMPNLGDLRSAGCIVNQISLTATVGGRTEAVVGIIGLGEQTAGSQTVSYAKPTRYLQGRHFTVEFGDEVSDLGSGTSFDAESLEIMINNNGAVDHALGSKRGVDVQALNQEIEAKFTLKMKSSDFETFRNSELKKAFRIEAENQSAGILGTASGLYPLLRFDVPPSEIEITRTRELNDIVKLELTVKAEFDFSEGFGIEGYLQNTTVSY